MNGHISFLVKGTHICKECGEEYQPAARGQKYCPQCRTAAYKRLADKRIARQKERRQCQS